MSADDLSSWLKVAAENKITTKNTWESTLIDHFSDIKQFKEIKGINFNKASSTLEGCVKVYSTRVDDVSEEALRLLEGFNLEGENRKKFLKKKGIKTIETNLQNINLKISNEKIFKDSIFFSFNKKNENTLLMSSLNVSIDGVYKLFYSDDKRDIKMCDFKQNKLILENKSICPTFNKYEDIIKPEVFEEPEEKFENIEYNESDDFIYENNELTQEENPVFKKTTFSYFKGWAGPKFWKVPSKRIESIKQNKSKEKYFIDFTEQVDIERIIEKGNTLLSQDDIEKRKNNKNLLPEDFRLEVNDLYKFNILDRQFNVPDIVVEEFVDLSILNEPQVIVEEPIDEIVHDMKNEKNFVFPLRKEQKKVDIKKLKYNIKSRIESKKNSKLSEIYRDIPKIYTEKEAKDISLHFCIVSLLHVANEQNLDLEIKDNDILIKE